MHMHRLQQGRQQGDGVQWDRKGGSWGLPHAALLWCKTEGRGGDWDGASAAGGPTNEKSATIIGCSSYSRCALHGSCTLANKNTAAVSRGTATPMTISPHGRVAWRCKGGTTLKKRGRRTPTVGVETQAEGRESGQRARCFARKPEPKGREGGRCCPRATLVRQCTVLMVQLVEQPQGKPDTYP